MFHYLVTDKKTKKMHLAECSAPSVAIADAAKDLFTAQRVEGPVLDALKATPGMELRKLTKPKTDPQPAGQEAGQEQDGAEKP